MSGSIPSASWALIRYANCWEDADVLIGALAPTPGRHILSIASGGDNVFALLAEGATVTATDLSVAQIAVVELKAAAIRHLDYPDLLGFLGVKSAENRLQTYASLRNSMTKAACSYWDEHSRPLAAGVIHAGKFENYFKLFRTRVLPLVHGRRTVASLMQPRDRAARGEFYEKVWCNRRWRWLFRLFFSRFIMGRLGRDPEFFRHVEGSVSDRILSRTRYALTELDPSTNPYLDYILEGNFTRALPRYLEPDRFAAVRDGLDRLSLHQSPIQEVAGKASEKYDGFNLSDIFEYLNPDQCLEVYRELLNAAHPRARFAYWNMLVPRRCPEPLRDQVHSLDEISRQLFAADRAFFYSDFVVEERKDQTP